MNLKDQLNYPEAKMSLKRKAESLFQSLFSDVSADSYDVERSRYRRYDQSEEDRNGYRKNDELGVRNQYRRNDEIGDPNQYRRYKSEIGERQQCRRDGERNHDPRNDDGGENRNHNGRYNRIEDEQSRFRGSDDIEERVRSEPVSNYGRLKDVGWSRCSPRSDEFRGGEDVLRSGFSPRPLISHRDSGFERSIFNSRSNELYGRREVERSRSIPRPTESHDERLRFNPSPTESHEDESLRYGTKESLDEQALRFGEDAHQDELLRFVLPTDVYERREKNEKIRSGPEPTESNGRCEEDEMSKISFKPIEFNEAGGENGELRISPRLDKSSGRKTVNFVGVQHISISQNKVEEEKGKEEDFFQKDLFEKRSLKSLPSSENLSANKDLESTNTSCPDSTPRPFSNSIFGPSPDSASGPSSGSGAVSFSVPGPSPGPSTGPVLGGIDDSLDQRLKMFQVSSPYQRMFNPDLREEKTEPKSSVVAGEREDNTARAERIGKTLLVPPVQTLEAYTMPAVKVRP